MKLYSLIIIVFIFILSCSKLILVREPEMRVLGGKTLIEAQVLGRYRQIDESFKRSDLVILTGGLGPTQDDITKEVCVKYLNLKMI